jgi:16S rRNA (cytidine1402-2'-O)-methyltransferase
MTGKLSIVATPIGNLEDITLRALRTLKEADYILCEDTRVTSKLLKHYDITAKTRRYDAHASEAVHASVLQDLEGGKHIALVSDAGTPGVSDPGVLLVERARKAGALIEAIPGPSSLTAAFSIAGIPGNEFAFLGFVPQKKGRQTFFKQVEKSTQPVIFFESTHRIMKSLDALKASLPKEKIVTVARELTKMHEEVVRGSAEEVFAYFSEHEDHQKGEFVIIISA